MRIATYNINHVLNRLPQLLAWLDVTSPDVVCLQELKCTERDFPFAALREAGYGAIVQGQKTWNGVAILAKGDPPLETRRVLPGDAQDAQSRYLEAAVQGVVVGCLYLPNGNPQPGPKYDYKLAWFQRLQKHAAVLIKTGHPVVLAGDYNVVPTDRDIYSMASWRDNALVQPAVRAAYAKLLKQGWIDAIRHQYPDEPAYTFWSYLRNRWPRDAGLRIDHLLVSPSLKPRLANAGIDKAMRGMEGSSDHAPAWIELS